MGTFKIWGGPVWNYDQKTALFRFNLENGDVKFATKGEVKGTLLNQFSMDESFRLLELRQRSAKFGISKLRQK